MAKFATPQNCLVCSFSKPPREHVAFVGYLLGAIPRPSVCCIIPQRSGFLSWA